MKTLVEFDNGSAIYRDGSIKRVVFEAPDDGEIVSPILIEFKGGPVRIAIDKKTGASIKVDGQDLGPFVFLGAPELTLGQMQQVCKKAKELNRLLTPEELLEIAKGDTDVQTKTAS